MTEVHAATAWELVQLRAEATPGELMFEGEDGRRLTFGEFRDEALRLSSRLAWVPEGCPVAWQLPTTLSACVLAAALAHRGAVQVPLLPSYRERELAFVVDQVGIPLLFMPTVWRGVDYREISAGLTDRRPGLRVVHADDLLADDLADRLPADLAPAPAGADPAGGRLDGARWVFYTSGTTGSPKGVKHGDAALIAAGLATMDGFALTDKDRHAIVFPLTHIGGIMWILVGLMVGMPQLLIEAFRPEGTIPLMRRFGVTVAGAGTAFHQAYLAAQRAQPGEPLFPDVRIFPGGAAPKPPHLHSELKEEMGGAGIVSAYGLTECPILAINHPTDPDEKLATTEGVAASGVSVRVIDADGVEVGPDGVGELRVRGPQLFLGYVEDTLDADAFDDSGWLRTGDLGSVDAEGHLTITGRLKDIIMRKGESIGAKEIEDLLYPHPDVADVAVIGLADAERGERICAVVQPARREQPPTLDQLVAYLRDQQIMPQKLPEQLELMDQLPRGAAGKVLKQDLRQRLAGSPGPS
jgi:acyl-CoA synthetase (AMP-forming)/AMP-acid ligase II